MRYLLLLTLLAGFSAASLASDLAKLRAEMAKQLPFEKLKHKENLYYYKGKPYTGKVSYHSTDKGTGILSLQEGRISGSFELHQSFPIFLHYKGSFKNFVFHGEYVSFQESGNTLERGTYTLGTKTGKWDYYDKTGRLMEEITYDHNGNSTYKRLYYVNGTYAEGDAENGKLHGMITTYNSGGSVRNTGVYFDDNKVGNILMKKGELIWTIYNGEREDGIPHGRGKILKVYRRLSGRLKFEIQYHGGFNHGIKHGEAKEFTNDYTFFGNWVNGKKEGPATITFRNGKECKSTWSGGKLVSYPRTAECEFMKIVGVSHQMGVKETIGQMKELFERKGLNSPIFEADQTGIIKIRYQNNNVMFDINDIGKISESKTENYFLYFRCLGDAPCIEDIPFPTQNARAIPFPENDHEMDKLMLLISHYKQLVADN